MTLPLPIVARAAQQMRQEALHNRRLRPHQRVRLWLQAEALLPRWCGQVLLDRALAEKDAHR